MEIKLVKSGGFCFGVKRAVDVALKSADEYKNKNIFTIGHIIHNNDIVKKLEERNILHVKLEDVSKIKESVVILRSHGVEKHLIELLKKNHNIIIDAICPFVKKIHEIVEKLVNEKYFVIIIGDNGHPEVKAIYSFTNKKESLIVSSPESEEFIDFLQKKNKRKIGVVAQTTQYFKNFKEICEKLIKIKGEIRVFNTICDATSKRQKETVDIAKKVDIMIVIGGKHSANTTRLKELSMKYLDSVYHIENKDELQKKWFKNKKTVGITAGASTPQFVIDEVIATVKKFWFIYSIMVTRFFRNFKKRRM